MPTDPALEAVRKVRREISRQFDNDPARLVARYIELQRNLDKSRIVLGPDDEHGASIPDPDAAQLRR
jgi:type II secretory pathway component HofQ